ncbi:MAG: SH3 domain-containing protein [Anaerolineae bacterium]|nr:SH3 domain-containing protein [Thermoflexales bacterium]MDW8395684.1 SH3 domain-containing protein [Anaerolineae bacterium]
MRISGLLFLATLVSTWTLLGSPADAQTRRLNPVGVNLLSNPGHEHPGVYFEGRGEINVTWDWVPFWEEPPAGHDPRDPYFRTPEFRPPFAHEYSYRVKSGGGSNRWFNYYALNKKAGIMQYVAYLPIGAPIRFTTYAQLWSSQDDHYNPANADRNDGDMKIRVCIDQDGGPRNMQDPELVCSPWAQPNNRWEQLVVDGVAKNEAVLVLIWSTASLPVQHNDAYVDESCFEILPAPGAPGICKGNGFVPTGSNVLLPPKDVVNLRVTAEEQRAALGASAPVAQTAEVKVPAGDVPALAVNARAGLNVRAQPSDNAAVLFTAPRGSVLSVLGRTRDGRWYQVQSGERQGWVSARLTLPNAAAKAAPVVSVAVSPEPADGLKPPSGEQPALTVNARAVLNLRAQPSESAEILASAPRGAVLAVLGKSADGKWFKVAFKDKQGWVSARLTLPNAAAQAAPVAR